MASSEQPNGFALIYGGTGALGSGCVSQFKAAGWWVASVETWRVPKDFNRTKDTTTIHVITDPTSMPNQNPNKEADVNILVHTDKSLQQQETDLKICLEDLLMGTDLDAVICVAGGYHSGNVNASFVENCERMWQLNVWPSIISASIAQRFLKRGGLLCLTGAKAALDGTPTNVAYGLTKSSIHQLIKSLAKSGSGMPTEALCIALLPITLDTLMNRQSMPTADISAWTPTKYITDLLFKWATGKDRPKNGSLVQFVTQNFNTDITIL